MCLDDHRLNLSMTKNQVPQNPKTPSYHESIILLVDVCSHSKQRPGDDLTLLLPFVKVKVLLRLSMLAALLPYQTLTDQ